MQTGFQMDIRANLKNWNRAKRFLFSMDELKAMESDDWKPTQKMIDFMGK